MDRKMINNPLDDIGDDTHIATSSSSSSSYDINQFSSDDERTIWKSTSNKIRLREPNFGLVCIPRINSSNDESIKIKYTLSDRERRKLIRLERSEKLSDMCPNSSSKKDISEREIRYPDNPWTNNWQNTSEEELRQIQDLFEDPNFNLPSSTNSLHTSGFRRNSRNPVLNLCSRLLECRNLIEAIEFVEENRRLIEIETSIIRNAPAFRNYDLSLYQIDYSVKESFNPNFWNDREPIVTTADGNCQYHAVSLSLTGSEDYTPQVRLATAVAVIDNRDWFDSMLQLIDKGSVLDLVHTISRNCSWGDETTLKAIAVAINKRIFLYTCNLGKKDYELVKSLSRDELLDAFREKRYRGGTGIHAYADPLVSVNPNDYIMLFHKSEHFIAVLPKSQQLTSYEPFNPIVPVLT